MSKGKLPFSEVSHIDCRTLEFATTLRGGYGKDENEMKVVSLLKKEQAAVQAEVAEKEGEMKCERYQCKKTVVQLVKIEMEWKELSRQVFMAEEELEVNEAAATEALTKLKTDETTTSKLRIDLDTARKKLQQSKEDSGKLAVEKMSLDYQIRKQQYAVQMLKQQIQQMNLSAHGAVDKDSMQSATGLLRYPTAEDIMHKPMEASEPMVIKSADAAGRVDPVTGKNLRRHTGVLLNNEMGCVWSCCYRKEDSVGCAKTPKADSKKHLVAFPEDVFKPSQSFAVYHSLKDGVGKERKNRVKKPVCNNKGFLALGYTGGDEDSTVATEKESMRHKMHHHHNSSVQDAKDLYEHLPPHLGGPPESPPEPAKNAGARGSMMPGGRAFGSTLDGGGSVSFGGSEQGRSMYHLQQKSMSRLSSTRSASSPAIVRSTQRPATATAKLGSSAQKLLQTVKKASTSSNILPGHVPGKAKTGDVEYEVLTDTMHLNNVDLRLTINSGSLHELARRNVTSPGTLVGSLGNNSPVRFSPADESFSTRPMSATNAIRTIKHTELLKRPSTAVNRHAIDTVSNQKPGFGALTSEVYPSKNQRPNSSTVGVLRKSKDPTAQIDRKHGRPLTAATGIHLHTTVTTSPANCLSHYTARIV